MEYLEIKIKEPWWGAHKKFGWLNNMWGVGLAKRDVNSAIDSHKMLKVNIWKFKKTYEIDPVKVQRYAEENNTKFTARQGTTLYVVPSIFFDNGQ